MDEMEEVEKALEANPEDPDEMQTLVDRRIRETGPGGYGTGGF